MTTHPHPSALRLFSPCDALSGYVDSSQAIPLRKPRRQRWLDAGTLYSRSIDVPFGPRVSGVAQVQPPAHCREHAAESSARPFGCETSAGGFLMRFFSEKNTPQLNQSCLRSVALPRSSRLGVMVTHCCRFVNYLSQQRVVAPRGSRSCATGRRPRWLGC